MLSMSVDPTHKIQILLIKYNGLHSRLYTLPNTENGYLPAIDDKKTLKDSGEKTASPRKEHTHITESVEIIKVKSWS